MSCAISTCACPTRTARTRRFRSAAPSRRCPGRSAVSAEQRPGGPTSARLAHARRALGTARGAAETPRGGGAHVAEVEAYVRIDGVAAGGTEREGLRDRGLRVRPHDCLLSSG